MPLPSIASFGGWMVVALERALGQWAQAVLAVLPAPAGHLEGVAMDGKTLRGTRADGVPGLHLLAAVSHRLGLTFGQVLVGEKTNEIPPAHTLIDGLLLAGRVLTMDALLIQRAIAQEIIDRKGDYLMVVKDNQPTLRAAIAFLFEGPEGCPAGNTRTQSTDRDHDRRERPIIAQVCRDAGFCSISTSPDPMHKRLDKVGHLS